MSDEFYIGWEQRAAPGIGRRTRGVALVLLVLAVLSAAALAVSQRLIGASVFEFGELKTFTGILAVEPYPHLLVPRPGVTEGAGAFSSYYLVAEWKFGLPPQALQSFDGHAVTLQGTLIYRGNQTMIQVADKTLQMAKTPVPPLTGQAIIPLGRQTLTGEIVDSKCYLGVMNPGQLTPHRACAIRCLSGGIPPVLLVRPQNGPPIYLLLVSAQGKPVNQQVLEYVAEPVSITGEVERQGEFLILRADPATYERIKPSANHAN
jgi:hypothetical protein